MTIPTALLAFTLAAIVLTITPGLDTALVLHTVATRGARAAWRAGLGIALGCLAWGLLAAAGLSAVLLASAELFGALKFAGAVYLVWLGIGYLRPSRGEAGNPTIAESGPVFRRGLLTNLLNPKVGLFYVAFLPQFVPVGAPVFALTIAMTAIHAVLGLAWFGLLIVLAARAGDWLGRASIRTWLDRVTGALFVGLGLKLAFDSR